jgi:hypothetical protein
MQKNGFVGEIYLIRKTNLPIQICSQQKLALAKYRSQDAISGTRFVLSCETTKKAKLWKQQFSCNKELGLLRDKRQC